MILDIKTVENVWIGVAHLNRTTVTFYVLSSVCYSAKYTDIALYTSNTFLSSFPTSTTVQCVCVYWPKTPVKQQKIAWMPHKLIKFHKTLLLKTKTIYNGWLFLWSFYPHVRPLYPYLFSITVVYISCWWWSHIGTLDDQHRKPGHLWRHPKNLHHRACCSFRNILCVQPAILRRSRKDTGVCSKVNFFQKYCLSMLPLFPALFRNIELSFIISHDAILTFTVVAPTTHHTHIKA